MLLFRRQLCLFSLGGSNFSQLFVVSFVAKAKGLLCTFMQRFLPLLRCCLCLIPCEYFNYICTVELSVYRVIQFKVSTAQCCILTSVLQDFPIICVILLSEKNLSFKRSMASLLVSKAVAPS